MPSRFDPDWIPAAIRLTADGPRVTWRRIGALRFTHPFFRDTLAAAGGAPTVETDWETLQCCGEQADSMPPTGFLFHLSRCGSTLVTQMLAALPQHSVLSEPEPVNHLLWPEEPDGRPDAECADRLRTLLRVLGRRRFAGEEGFFVKFDCWHTLDLPLLRRTFPQVPWIFVYREPVSILASHTRSRGTQMIPGLLDPGKLGVPPPPWTMEGLREFAAGVVGRIEEAALEHHDSRCRLVHYRELPGVLPELLRHFGVTVSQEERRLMMDTAGRDSKNPSRPRTPPVNASADIPRPVPVPVSAAEVRADQLYARLEILRRAQF